MLDLEMMTTIIGAITWLHSFGKGDIAKVKQETEELLVDLSKSLVNMHDLATSIAGLCRRVPSLSDHDFVEAFQDIKVYAEQFYFNDKSIRSARTRCGDVARDIERIKFKLVTILRSDLGKWKEVDEHFRLIVDEDDLILQDYKNNIDLLKDRLSDVEKLILDGKVDQARLRFEELGKDLNADCICLRKGVDEMEAAFSLVREAVS